MGKDRKVTTLFLRNSSESKDSSSDTFTQLLNGVNSNTTKIWQRSSLNQDLGYGQSHKAHGIDCNIPTLWGLADGCVYNLIKL